MASDDAQRLILTIATDESFRTELRQKGSAEAMRAFLAEKGFEGVTPGDVVSAHVPPEAENALSDREMARVAAAASNTVTTATTTTTVFAGAAAAVAAA
jgi:predicted ribosomally synthesized peptide with nif11-like leader